MKTAFGPRGGLRRIKGSKAGLTLVELMVSITILMIAVAGSIAAQLSADRLVQTSQQTSAASADLQACMERLRLWSYADLELVLGHADAADVLGDDNYTMVNPVSTADQAVGDFVTLLNSFDDLHLQDERVMVAFPNAVLGADLPDPIELRVTVTWQDHRGGDRQLQLSSLKTK